MPTPYPDELIGSVLARAVIHNGLAPKRLVTHLLGTPGRSNYSMFLPTNLPDLAIQTRTDAKTLLWGHTVFPYAVAFMPTAEVHRLEKKLLVGCPADQGSTASLVKSVTHGIPEFRYCPRCAREELLEKGESYWHRTHCLPGVRMCLKHGHPLHGTMGRPTTLAQNLSMPLPHRQRRHIEIPKCSLTMLHQVAQTSATICHGPWMHQSEWLSDYRARATALKLTLPSGLIAGARMAFELQEAFGVEYLSDAGCEYAALERAWPALMVRERCRVPFAPAKHILLSAFFTHYQSADSSFSYRKPGKTPIDSARVDRWLATAIKKRVDAAIQRKEIVTVKSLLEDTGKWQTFRHHRASFPLTLKQVEAFKKSEASQRKTGGREAHAKKLLAIHEGRQKPFAYKLRLRKKMSDTDPYQANSANL
ncbi:TniQ family protein [uncultured Delftia sp.]|uniref:TniQ family protein n=1 Tax=uncultured Delftia sp. TaxID=191464 RepID=UPI002595E295|nr:TniQ family protein [uncultured Delftia sp.]